MGSGNSGFSSWIFDSVSNWDPHCCWSEIGCVSAWLWWSSCSLFLGQRQCSLILNMQGQQPRYWGLFIWAEASVHTKNKANTSLWVSGISGSIKSLCYARISNKKLQLLDALLLFPSDSVWCKSEKKNTFDVSLNSLCDCFQSLASELLKCFVKKSSKKIMKPGMGIGINQWAKYLTAFTITICLLDFLFLASLHI